MPQHNSHFPSIQAWIQALEQSKDMTGSWINLTSPATDASLDPWCGGTDCPQSLDDFCQQTRDLHGLESTIQQIQYLARDLQLDLPQLPSTKRIKAWGTAGSTVAVQRVLHGSTKPWRRTSTAPVHRTARTATLLLPCTFPYFMSASDIVWTVAASCAYASMLHTAGVSVEIVAVSACTNIWGKNTDSLCTITLKSLGASWDIHGLALLCQAAWCRRGLFRYWEIQATDHQQPLSGTYGLCPTLEGTARMVAQHTAWSPAQTLCWGAHYSHKITDHASAKAWIQAQNATPLVA